MTEVLVAARGPLAVTAGATSLLVAGPVATGEKYRPTAGDVWAAGVWCTAGVPVGSPTGWALVAERPRMPWPSGRAGAASASCWYRTLAGGESPTARVSFPLGLAASAEGFLVVYRLPPFVCPSCGRRSVAAMDVSHGYCQVCRDWTGPAAPRPDQLARRPLDEVFQGAGVHG